MEKIGFWLMCGTWGLLKFIESFSLSNYIYLKSRFLVDGSTYKVDSW